MPSLRSTVRIDAPPEDVWRVLVDADRLPEWNEEIVAVEDVTGPLDRAGVTYTQVMHAAGRDMRSRFEVVSADPPRSRVLKTEMPMGGKGTALETLTPVEGGTELQIELEFQLPGTLGRLGGGAMKKMMERAFERNGRSLKALVESGA